MHNVILLCVTGSGKGNITLSKFDNEDKFIKWYDKTMRRKYLVVAQGINQEQAILVQLASFSWTIKNTYFL
ncbi:MAG: hypothetical protein A2725_03180 [Candidatus Magasanikbacteria bacterium RIFCSPHIGHO2_01_FULL_33_34]|uniref:Uncharacterized protein n=1 Tax=Candidatus Magasanikbacteria bacterium RIFCSPHIGHO2_01_FULL_33_34 TaxID=1798671 RepID=A0A1F6LHB5_9BACT|nr:MAG: hypothetical protein A2725_03180 [Candidatus Magasanikbacteria bacterium RIFCSPHIGHO2_01_FULL_33_34]OGH66134.1 MAG: hypothetical protein A3B83_00670 [Candidatus Magasanikbacteria bacterium RIFCSPHIGHO2_02_FULL_33_17]OGH75980.1 MAG: hypothetical protein A3A89_00580 [Candidatus Magasanikbacteria bacterium RIFCSPLOWO2_01_FULL_33_34]OGH81578.1 MAG: hypothetical protein A3F93_03395 [Candidatus Magasanikbacteria bacterium RIFCSPLOWO2_12_FULL_34_7]